MIESVGDLLGVIVMLAFCFVGFYFFYRVSAKHHENRVKNLEARYYRYYDDDEEDEDDSNGPYYE